MASQISSMDLSLKYKMNFSVSVETGLVEAGSLVNWPLQRFPRDVSLTRESLSPVLSALYLISTSFLVLANKSAR